MALRLLDEPPIDIHTGGVDLIFPHHENEIAQSECATGKQFSRFWVHAEHLLVDGQKMSKSVGNVYTLKDITDRNHRISALRYLLLSGHYRKQLNFTWTGLEQAEESLTRLSDFLGRLKSINEPGRDTPAVARSRGRGAARLRRRSEQRSQYVGGLRRDVRSGARRQHAHRCGRGWHRRRAGHQGAFDHFDSVLGVLSLRRAEDERPPIPVEEIERLIAEREAARAPA